MTNNETVSSKEFIKIWLIGACVCWVGITSTFGASADLITPNTNPRTEMMAVLVYIPIISLLWPVWINILLGSPPPNESAIKQK